LATEGAERASGSVRARSATDGEVAGRFLNSRKNEEHVAALLDPLASFGRARELADGR
jgi:hypothetical protein